MSSESKRMEPDELIRLAKLMLAIDSDEHPEAANFQRSMARLSTDDALAVLALSKLLDGKPYTVYSNRSVVIDRTRKVAELVGAIVAEEDADAWPIPRVVFAPPPRQ